MIAKYLTKEARLSSDEAELYYSKYYDKADKGHGRDHIDGVRAAMAQLVERHKYRRPGLADTAALLHDIGVVEDRKTHEHVGADLILKDALLKSKYGDRDIRTLSNAVRNHRASTGNPKSILAKLLNDADRLGVGDQTGIERGYNYRVFNNPEMSEDEMVMDAARHIKEKYGAGGSGLEGTYMPGSKEQLQQQVAPYLEALENNDMDALREFAGLNKKKS